MINVAIAGSRFFLFLESSGFFPLDALLRRIQMFIQYQPMVVYSPIR